MNICDYGCGQEAKIYFKSTKKWCCSKSTNSCPKIREIKKEKMETFWNEDERNKQAVRTKNRFKDPEERKKQSKRIISYFKKDGSKEKSSKASIIRFENETIEEKEMRIQTHIEAVTTEVRKKQSVAAIDRFKNESKEERKKRIETIKNSWTEEKRYIQKTLSEKYYKEEDFESKQKRIHSHRKSYTNEVRQKVRNKNKYTIEYINKTYPFFSFIEEIRYNPYNLNEKEIQTHCTNSSCLNSKEKGGWFTPSDNELSRRIYALEKDDGDDGSYLYCSYECKKECCLFNLRQDPNILKPFQRYRDKVLKETYITTKIYSYKIKNYHLRSNEYHLDHKFSIYEGFKQNVDPKLIAHYKNLEVISRKENLEKNSSCSITLEQLLSF